MTTHVIDGLYFKSNNRNEPKNFLEDAEISIVVRDEVTSFSYDYINPNASGDARLRMEFTIDANLTVSFPGTELTNADLNASYDFEALDIVWGNGSRSTLICIHDHDSPAGFIFQLGGDPLPDFADVDAFNAFDATITSADPASAPFSPNTPIPFASIVDVMTTEDDSLFGTNAGDDFASGIGDDALHGAGGDDILSSGSGDDYIRGDGGNDRIDPGPGQNFVEAGTGNDIIDLSDHSPNSAFNPDGNDYIYLSHRELSEGIIVNVDGAANTMTVDKGANGVDTVIDITNPLQSGWGWGGVEVFGTDHNDVYNVSTTPSTFIHLIGSRGNDTYNLSTDGGIISLEYAKDDEFQAIQTGIVADFGTGIVSNDGYGFTDTVNVTSVGEYGLEVRATDADDVIKGGDLNERFILRAGNDTLDGGGGVDLVRYDRREITTGVTVDLEAGTATGLWDGSAFSHTLSNIEEVRGSRSSDDTLLGSAAANELAGRGGNDLIAGRGGNDELYGQDGNDTLNGGAGNDLLDGGSGFDTADYSAVTDDMVASLQFGGAQRVSAQAGRDTFVSVEGITGGSGDDLLVGTSGGNVIVGGAGNDEIYGIGGGDILRGGIGDDQIEGSGGNDTMEGGAGDADVLSYFNAAGAVRVDMRSQGTAQSVGGSAGTDTFTGFEDLYGSNAGADTLIGDTGDNRILGFSGNDRLYGFDGADDLVGMKGADLLVGGRGADTLSGGGGADVFDFNAVNESTGASRDTIRDFGVGGADIVNLGTIDANGTVAGNQAFSFVGSGVFTGAGDLRFVTNGTDGFVLGDVDGDGAVDLNIRLLGVTAMDAGDFVL